MSLPDDDTANHNQNKSDNNNLLALENKFIFRQNENNQYELVENKIQDIISKFTGDRSHLEQIPVALIAVMGSDEQFLRKYHTDWLIRYFKNDKESSDLLSSRKSPTSRNLEFMKHESDIPSGVYIWPEPFVIPTTAGGISNEIICWIIHVDGPNIDVLEKFVALACSQIIVFQQNEKDFYENLPVVFRNKPLAQLPSYHIYSKTHDAIKDGAEVNNNHFHDFCDYLAEMPISSTVDGGGVAVTLNTFLKYIRSVVSIINEELETKNEGADSEQKVNAPTMSLKNSPMPLQTQCGGGANIRVDTSNTDAPNVRKKFKKRMPLIRRKKTGKKTEQALKSVSTSNITLLQMKPVENGNFEAALGAQTTQDSSDNITCKKLNCSKLEGSLIPLITNWINTTMNQFNIAEMLDCVHSHQSKDKYNIFGELEDVVNLVVIFRDEISNIFDNYVCFEGEIDKKQMKRFGDNAYRSAEKALKEKKHIHSQLTINILNCACEAVRGHFARENEDIIRLEENAVVQLIVSIFAAYEKKMAMYIKENYKMHEIKALHTILKDHCILMADRCLNAEARINGVVKQAIELLGNKLDNEFGKLISEIQIDSPIDLSINIYLKLFNDQIVANLEKIDNFFQLFALHQEICNSAVVSLTNVERETAMFRFDTHLAYVMEVEQVRRQTVRDLSFENGTENQFPLCVYFTTNWLRLDAMVSPDKCITILHGSKRTIQLPAFAAITGDNKIILGAVAEKEMRHRYRFLKDVDKLVNFLARYAPNSLSDFVLTEVFGKLKHVAEKVFKRPFLSAVVTIPLQLNVWNRLCLRQCIHKAGFDHVYLVSETSLAIYGILKTQHESFRDSTGETDMAAVINIDISGIRFEMYKCSRGEEKRKCKLVAGSFQVWQSSKLDSKSGWKPAFNLFSCQEQRNTDCVGTLETAFEIVKSQMSASFIEKQTPYIIISEKPEFETIFNPFFSLHPYLVKVDEFRNMYTLPMATEFSMGPHQITQLIIDHAAHVDNNLPHGLSAIEGNTASACLDSSVEVNISNPIVDLELVRLRENLLAQCRLMEKQIHEGSVKIRVLMKKIVLDAIQRAKSTAKNVDATNDVVEAEQAEITELFEEHNFIK